MLTWMDNYVRVMASVTREQMALIGRSLEIRDVSDFELTREYVRGVLPLASSEIVNPKPIAAATYESAKAAGLGHLMGGPDVPLERRAEWMQGGMMMAMCVAPYFEGSSTALAIHLEPDLVEDFQGGKAPETDEWEKVFEKTSNLFIDVPRGLFHVGTTPEGEDMCVVAIFAWSLPSLPRHLTVCVAPKDKLHLDYQHELSFLWGKRTSEENYWNNTVHENTLLDNIENLVKLTCLYYLSGEGGRAMLPHVEPKDAQKIHNPKKRALKLKTHSMFNILDLRSPSGRFGRSDQEKAPSGGWKIGVRSKVRGHFRWQAYGHKWSLHRLQWIAAHERGPKDAPERPEMVVLKKK